MSSKTFRNSCLLVLTALIWGVAFVAQSSGGDAIGPYSFNCIRSLIGGIVLLPVIKILDSFQLTNRKPMTKREWSLLLKGGISCGIILCLASNFQQLGISAGTPAGKAGFLTACYIVLVPILGIFLKKKCPWNVWLGVIFTVIGLYLLCLDERLTFQFSDILVLICAFIFSLHILVIDHFSPLVDGVRMSCIQFFTCGILTAFPMIGWEIIPNGTHWIQSLYTMDAWIPILYAGVCSCGIAYTLQIIGQQDVNPTIASLLMSLESVFSVLAGWALLHEVLSTKEIFGCVIIFIAILLAQIPFENLHRKK
ncbi:MAG: DMT family transporter [Firmicutes bacterium]|nr:DMT family transporter [Bacillota bacterium]